VRLVLLMLTLHLTWIHCEGWNSQNSASRRMASTSSKQAKAKSSAKTSSKNNKKTDDKKTSTKNNNSNNSAEQKATAANIKANDDSKENMAQDQKPSNANDKNSAVDAGSNTSSNDDENHASTTFTKAPGEGQEKAYHAVVGDWGICTSLCLHQRLVECFDDTDVIVAPSFCTDLPSEVETCSGEKCGETGNLEAVDDAADSQGKEEEMVAKESDLLPDEAGLASDEDMGPNILQDTKDLSEEVHLVTTEVKAIESVGVEEPAEVSSSETVIIDEPEDNVHSNDLDSATLNLEVKDEPAEVLSSETVMIDEPEDNLHSNDLDSATLNLEVKDELQPMTTMVLQQGSQDSQTNNDGAGKDLSADSGLESARIPEETGEKMQSNAVDIKKDVETDLGEAKDVQPNNKEAEDFKESDSNEAVFTEQETGVEVQFNNVEATEAMEGHSNEVVLITEETDEKFQPDLAILVDEENGITSKQNADTKKIEGHYQSIALWSSTSSGHDTVNPILVGDEESMLGVDAQRLDPSAKDNQPSIAVLVEEEKPVSEGEGSSGSVNPILVGDEESMLGVDAQRLDPSAKDNQPSIAVLVQEEKPVLEGEVSSGSGWYKGGLGKSCSQACEARNLLCSEDELYLHNHEVDTFSELLSIIETVGGPVPSISNCTNIYGARGFAPSWSKSSCVRSIPHRPLESFNCDAYPPSTSRRRLCYCSPGSSSQDQNFQSNEDTTNVLAQPSTIKEIPPSSAPLPVPFTSSEVLQNSPSEALPIPPKQEDDEKTGFSVETATWQKYSPPSFPDTKPYIPVANSVPKSHASAENISKSQFQFPLNHYIPSSEILQGSTEELRGKEQQKFNALLYSGTAFGTLFLFVFTICRRWRRRGDSKSVNKQILPTYEQYENPFAAVLEDPGGLELSYRQKS